MEGNETPGQGPPACHLLTYDHGWPVPKQVVIGEVKIITGKPVFGGLTFSLSSIRKWRKVKSGCCVSRLLVRGAAFDCQDCCLSNSVVLQMQVVELPPNIHLSQAEKRAKANDTALQGGDNMGCFICQCLMASEILKVTKGN